MTLSGSHLAEELLVAIEVHSLERIRAVLDAGLDPRAPVRGETPVTWMVEMYTRSDAFPACLRLLLDRGGELDDPVLAPVLLNDAAALSAAIAHDPRLIEHRASMRSTFTPLDGASLLHVAAEFGHLDVARVLIDAGADVNARAAVDEHGLNGHTPIFHTVNSNDNRSAPIMGLLVEAGATVDVCVPGITWGRGFEWETTLFDMTPISYAQCGLLPQMHRQERHIDENVRFLLAAAGRPVPPLANVPNRYLRSSKD